jgi:hypothetical protein
MHSSHWPSMLSSHWPRGSCICHAFSYSPLIGRAMLSSHWPRDHAFVMHSHTPLSLAKPCSPLIGQGIMHLSCILILPSHWPSHALFSLVELSHAFLMHNQGTTLGSLTIKYKGLKPRNVLDPQCT